METMVYSFFWVMQDLYHPPYHSPFRSLIVVPILLSSLFRTSQNNGHGASIRFSLSPETEETSCRAFGLRVFDGVGSSSAHVLGLEDSLRVECLPEVPSPRPRTPKP